jgi:nucleoside-diphosphate-sugar epimerase
VVVDKLTYAGYLANLEPVAGHRDLEFVRGDICDQALVRRLMEGVGLVVHFAAESHVDRSTESSQAFVRTNVEGTRVLLQAAVDAGVERFVHVSTDEVYGSITEGSWPEEHPLSPNSPYAVTKAATVTRRLMCAPVPCRPRAAFGIRFLDLFLASGRARLRGRGGEDQIEVGRSGNGPRGRLEALGHLYDRVAVPGNATGTWSSRSIRTRNSTSA